METGAYQVFDEDGNRLSDVYFNNRSSVITWMEGIKNISRQQTIVIRLVPINPEDFTG